MEWMNWPMRDLFEKADYLAEVLADKKAGDEEREVAQSEYTDALESAKTYSGLICTYKDGDRFAADDVRRFEELTGRATINVDDMSDGLNSIVVGLDESQIDALVQEWHPHRPVRYTHHDGLEFLDR